ncbi:hypothetical protein P4B35_05580 [Pontiellaceae bacterium B12227]|nr:hypothetical protein [Pontiellaceae bacterium B12227]
MNWFYKIFAATVLPGMLTVASDAARTVLRLSQKDGVLQQYYDQPDAFPTCRQQLDYITYNLAPDGLVRNDGKRLFQTQQATIEIFKGAGKKYKFTGEETVDAIRQYEAVGLTVGVVIIYHEDWLKLRGEGGPWKEDIRILSADELKRVRKAIGKSDLKSKKTVKLVQLMGARVAGHRGDSWFQITKNPTLMRHLKNFDGIGVECHVGDHLALHKGKPSDGPNTLKCIAEMAKWCKQNRKITLMFMGGGPLSYSQFDACRETYEYMWKQMSLRRVNKDDSHLLYFRQGARPGRHLPESSNKTLTYQMKWLIGEVK